MKHFISLDEMLCTEDKITYKFSSSLDVFQKNGFFIRYDRPIQKSAESLNVVPFAAVMAPIGWATGAKLVLPALDEEFALSLERCSHYFKKWFSEDWSFASSILAPRVRNTFSPDRPALLFSGGLDSMTTYIRHKEKNPILFTIFGADIPLAQHAFIEQCKKQFDAFARMENVPLHYIYTDMRDALRLDKLKTYCKNWYGDVAHGLMLLSLAAPSSSHEVQTLMAASCSHRAGACYPCGSEKDLIQEIRWAHTGVESDNHGVDRLGKIRNYLKKNEKYYPYLRVCWQQFEDWNCSRCEKCLRTICELLLNNIDPALCHFHIDNETLPRLKKEMLNRYDFFFRGENALDFWRTIQENVCLHDLADRYGAVEFFEWFSDFEKIKKRQHPLALHFFGALIDARNLASKVGRPLKALVKERASV